MKNSPRVSVVIPTYNHAAYVVQAVASAVSQTLPPLEVIVVDDGSTDGTREALAPQRDRIRYVHQANGGLSAARNTGVRAARGDWVALLDADDLWHSQKLEVQLSVLDAHPDAVLIGSPSSPAPPAGPLASRCAARPVALREFLTGTPFGPSSAVVRRDIVDEVGGFDESLTSVEDRDMWLRIAAGHTAVLADSPCWWYRPSPHQMSRNAERMLRNYRKVLDTFFAERRAKATLRRHAYAVMHLDAAFAYSESGRLHRAVAHVLRSAAWHPLRSLESCGPWLRSRFLLVLLGRLARRRLGVWMGRPSAPGARTGSAARTGAAP